MEAVGVVASLLQLVDAALRVAKTSKEFFKSYQEAPAISKTVENQRILLQSVLDEYTHLRPCLEFGGSNSNPLPLDSRQLVATALLQVSEALQKLRTTLDYCEQGHTKASRMRWAFSKKKDVKEAQAQLEISKSTLTHTLLLLSIRFSALHQSSIEEVAGFLKRHVNESSTTTRLLQQPEGRRTIELQSGFNEPVTSTRGSMRHEPWLTIDYPQSISSENTTDIKPYSILDPAAQNLKVFRVRTLELLAPDHGISGLFSSISGSNKTTYSLSLRANLPWWLGNRILAIQWKIRYYLSSWLNLNILPGCISLSGYVSKDSLVAKACLGGDEVMVRKLFSEGKANPNDIILNMSDKVFFPWLSDHLNDGDETTILAAAIRSGSLPLVKYMIDVGANANLSFGSVHTSPLQLAAYCGNLDMIRLLITRGAFLDHLDSHEAGLFLHLALSAFSLFMQSVLNNDRRLAVSSSLYDFIEPLHGYGYSFDLSQEFKPNLGYEFCIGLLDAKSVAFLLQEGCTPLENQDPEDCIVGYATVFKNVGLLKYLLPLATKAQINKALLLAMCGDLYNILDLQVDVDILYSKRIAEADIISVELLLSYGAHIESRDADDRTPLHWASTKDVAHCVKLLLKYGANIQAKDKNGCTPLHDACWKNAPNCVKLLLENGANKEAKADDGSTPLHYASWTYASDCVKLLLERGANPHATDNNGLTPLHTLIDASPYRPSEPSTSWNDALSHLLLHGADPKLPIPVSVRRDSSQDGGPTPDLKAMYRIEDFLIHRKGMEERAAFYYKSLHDEYPEIIVDTTGAVYWDAKEQLESPAYGAYQTTTVVPESVKTITDTLS